MKFDAEFKRVSEEGFLFSELITGLQGSSYPWIFLGGYTEPAKRQSVCRFCDLTIEKGVKRVALIVRKTHPQEVRTPSGKTWMNAWRKLYLHPACYKKFMGMGRHAARPISHAAAECKLCGLPITGLQSQAYSSGTRRVAGYLCEDCRGLEWIARCVVCRTFMPKLTMRLLSGDWFCSAHYSQEMERFHSLRLSMILEGNDSDV